MDIHQVYGVLKVACWLGFFVAFVVLCFNLVNLIGDLVNKKPKKKHALGMLICFVLLQLFLFGTFGFALKQYETNVDIEELSVIPVTSENLSDGKWDQAIGNRHDNLSPQLSWSEVYGANCYAIVMIDPDAGNWLHWYAEVEGTSVELGSFSGKDQGYVGPYPPSGSHEYEVYVFALRDRSNGLSVDVDGPGATIDKITEDLAVGGASNGGNILAMGMIEGQFGES